MKKDNHRVMAERFMREQLAIMRKFGPVPKIDPGRYEEAISGTRRTLMALCPTKVLGAGQSR